MGAGSGSGGPRTARAVEQCGGCTEGKSPAYSGSDSAMSSCAAAARGAQAGGGGARGAGGGGGGTGGASPLRQWTQLWQPSQLAHSGQAKQTPGGFFLRSLHAQWLFFVYDEQFLSGGSSSLAAGPRVRAPSAACETGPSTDATAAALSETKSNILES